MSFWLSLDGGPCAGMYFTARAPERLKAVVDRKGKRDVLDLPEDEPRAGEDVHLYERTSSRAEGILCGRGGCGHIVQYRYVRVLAGQTTLDLGSDFSTSSEGAKPEQPQGTLL